MVHFLFLRKVERFAIQCMNSLLNSMGNRFDAEEKRF